MTSRVGVTIDNVKREDFEGIVWSENILRTVDEYGIPAHGIGYFETGPAYALCCASLCGCSGLHRFYLGDYFCCCLYCFTCGWCGLGNAADLFCNIKTMVRCANAEIDSKLKEKRSKMVTLQFPQQFAQVQQQVAQVPQQVTQVPQQNTQVPQDFSPFPQNYPSPPQNYSSMSPSYDYAPPHDYPVPQQFPPPPPPHDAPPSYEPLSGQPIQGSDQSSYTNS